MKRARRIVITVLLCAVAAAFTSASTWSQPDPQYQEWMARTEALYAPGVDENMLLNQLEQAHFVTDTGRGGKALPGMYFPDFALMDLDNGKHELYKATKEQGKWVVALTGSGFT